MAEKGVDIITVKQDLVSMLVKSFSRFDAWSILNYKYRSRKKTRKHVNVDGTKL